MTFSLGDAIKVMKKSQFIMPIPLNSMKEMVIIVPVKDNQVGITNLLNSFFRFVAIDSYPSAIIIVDNNSKEKIKCPLQYQNHPSIFIDIIECKTVGPAAARNKGAKRAVEKYKANWLFFIDSDCLFTLETLQNLSLPAPEAIAYQFDIIPNGEDWLSRFYHENAILRPIALSAEKTDSPETLVTAGALILAKAFFQIGGFSESFPDAAGEDTFLGIKLRTLGELAYLRGRFICHDFIQFSHGPTTLDMFLLVKRFYRYGKGNKLVELKLLQELDIHIDKSPNKELLLSEREFYEFLAKYCNPNTATLLLHLDNNLILKVCHTAMYYGYHGLSLDIDQDRVTQLDSKQNPTDTALPMQQRISIGPGNDKQAFKCKQKQQAPQKFFPSVFHQQKKSVVDSSPNHQVDKNKITASAALRNGFWCCMAAATTYVAVNIITAMGDNTPHTINKPRI